MKPIRVTPPKVKPVTLDELKEAARVDFTDDNRILEAYLDAAIDHLDGWSGVLGRAIIDQEWQINASVWPSYGIVLPFGDVSAATIKYVGVSGDELTLPDSAYEVVETATGSMLRFRRDFDRPALAGDRSDAVHITFTTGYGADASKVPPSIKVAIMLLATHWYENREATSGIDVRKLPLAVDALITPHRRVLF
ncbi:head-tail connector protein [Brucellaceae bacterium C25G]